MIILSPYDDHHIIKRHIFPNVCDLPPTLVLRDSKDTPSYLQNTLLKIPSEMGVAPHYKPFDL